MRRAADKLIYFAKKAEKGHASALNLLKGRLYTEQALKKLMVETVPKLDHIKQNFVKIEKRIRHRRGDNAPMVFVTVRGSEKEEALKLQKKEAKERSGLPDSNEFNRGILIEEKTHYENLLEQHPEKEAFFRKKIAKVEFDLWTIDKGRLDKRVNLLV